MERKKKQSARKEKQVRRPPPQEVVYTPPVPLNRKKFLLVLATVASVVLAIFISCSIFFRVGTIEVSGASKYTAWTIKEASGIETGEGLLSFGKAAAAGRIMEKLRYVKSVRIGVTLPDTVNIYIEELDVVYSVQDQVGGWWFVSADGRVVEQVSESEALEHTLLNGFCLDTPKQGEAPEAWEPDAEQTDEQGDEVSDSVSNEERLETALSIATELEKNKILGDVTSIDLTDLNNIQLWYGTKYQVRLGDPGEMDVKIGYMKSVIEQHKQDGGYQSGVLDVTLTMYPDSVPYTPF